MAGNPLFSNVRIDPDKAYVLFIGDTKFMDTTNYLGPMLEMRYGKPVEIINILSNMPSPSFWGNIVVLNEELTDIVGEKAMRYRLEVDQSRTNSEASSSPEISKIIDSILANQDDLFINVYKNTPELTLQDGHRIHVLGPSPDLFKYFNNKLTQRRIAESLSIPVPKGMIVDGKEQLIKAYRNMSGSHAFINAETGAGGSGSQIVRGLEDIFSSPKLRKDSGYVITELLDLVASPVAIGITANPDEVMAVSVSDQIMEGVEYKGNSYPSQQHQSLVDKMKEYTKRIGKHMAQKGYRGIFGVDFMVDRKGDLYFTEINPRKVGHTPEMIRAYRYSFPNLPTIPELEYLAVTQGTLGLNLKNSYVPSQRWGVFTVKAGEGHTTDIYLPPNMSETQAFENSGFTVLDHPGKGITYLKKGKLARIVYVAKDDDTSQIVEKLDHHKRMLEAA